MASQNDRVNRLRIASPCPANWDQMSGDDRIRFCNLCNLHVYNISQITRRETETLFADTEGRICARLFRRIDGTIITKDCPVGLRAVRRRLARVAGAAFAAIVSLVATVMGQKPIPKDKSSCQQQVTVTKLSTGSKREPGSISGTVVDPNGNFVHGARIKVTRKSGEVVTASRSDDRGRFQVRGLKSDTYELILEFKGFASLKVNEIRLGDKDEVVVAAILMPSGITELIGVVGDEPLLNRDSATRMTIFSGDLIRRLPH
jgi:hypothetical protein